MWNQAYPQQSQHLVLLDDGSFVCTCLLLVHTGIVCRHFFHLMAVKGAKYHIGFIPRRWYKEEIQDDISFDPNKMPFVLASINPKPINAQMDLPLPTFMNTIKAFFPSMPAPQPMSSKLSKMEKYGELNGLFKRVADQALDDYGLFDRFKEFMEKEVVKGMPVTEIRNPVVTSVKGRPRKKRMASVFESRKKVASERTVIDGMDN